MKPLLSSLIIISAIIFAVAYCYLSSFHYEHEEFKLHVLQSNLAKTLKHELESANSNKYKNLFLFSNYKLEIPMRKSKEEMIVTDQNTLVIVTQEYKLTLDLQELKEFVDKIIPSHIAYKISLDANIVAVKDFNAEQYISSSFSTNINNIVTLFIDLGVNKNSEYYQKSIDKFYRNYFTSVILISLLITCCATHYLFIKNIFLTSNQNLERKIKHLRNNNYSLHKYTKVIEKLENMFVGLESNSRIEVFEIDTKEIADDLTSYFIDDQANVQMQIATKAQFITAFCSKENFYQLIFSLTNLLIHFIAGQNDEQKSIIISFDKRKTTFQFESFALDEEKMIYLADNVLCLPKSFFLLSCRHLFQSLKNNNFKFRINMLDGYNHQIDIISLSEEEIQKTNKEDNRIFNFRNDKNV